MLMTQNNRDAITVLRNDFIKNQLSSLGPCESPLLSLDFRCQVEPIPAVGPDAELPDLQPVGKRRKRREKTEDRFVILQDLDLPLPIPLLCFLLMQGCDLQGVLLQFYRDREPV